MKGEDLLKAIGQIDDKYIEETENSVIFDSVNNDISEVKLLNSENVRISSLKKSNKLRIAVSIAACLCIVVVCTVVVLTTSNKTDIPESNPSQVVQGVFSQDDEDLLGRQKDENKASYKETSENPKANTSDVESSIPSETSDKNNDKSQSGESSVEPGTVNPSADLPYVSEPPVTASQGEVSEASDSEGGGALLSHDYMPNTLGDFVKDLQLKDTLEIIGGTYAYQEGNYIHTDEINGDNSAFVFDMLLTDENAKNDGEIGDSIPVIEICVSVSNLKSAECQNRRLWVTENGYVCTDILGSQKSFFIGTDKVQAFIDYVKENCEVKEYLFDVEKDDYVYENDLTSQIKSE